MSARIIRIDGSLPRLYIPWPACGHCDEDVTIEDGRAWCDNCLIEWHSIDEETPSQPDSERDGTEVPCGIVTGTQDQPHDDNRGNHYIPGPPLPCILPSGHEGRHLCPHDVEVSGR